MSLKKQFEEKLKEVKEAKINYRDFKNLYNFVNKVCEENNIDKQSIDIFSLIDMSLNYYENLELLKKYFKENFGIGFISKNEVEKFKEQEIEFWEKQKEEELRELRERILKESDTDINNKFENLEKAINYLINSNEKKGLIILGHYGWGKTFNTMRILNNLNVNSYWISGHITSLQLYRVLYENNGKIIVLDDVIGLMNNKINLTILLSALDKGKEVSWITKPEILYQLNLPSSFIFNGKVIIIANQINMDNEFQRALKDRCLVLSMNFNRNEILEMLYTLAKKDNLTFLVDWLNTNKIDLSLRDYTMLKDIYRVVGNDWERLAKMFVLNEIDREMNDIDRLILEINIREKDKSNNQKAKLFVEITGMDRRTYYRHLKKLRRLGLL